MTTFEGLRPVGESDYQCMAEVREVLAKHGALDRFGLSLLHSHFPIGDDEILEESHDLVMRSISIKPAKKMDAVDRVATLFKLKAAETPGRVEFEVLQGCISNG